LLVSKDLCQIRGSIGTPEEMEKRFRMLAQGEYFEEVTTIDHESLQKNGMNLFWNVGKGAVSKPRLVYARYMGKKKAGGDDSIDIAYVGKGITYDTGGLNIKL
jgi:leucyl aminopeptidase